MAQLASPLFDILVGKDARWFRAAERRIVDKDFVIQARAHCCPIVLVEGLLKATDHLRNMLMQDEISQDEQMLPVRLIQYVTTTPVAPCSP